MLTQSEFSAHTVRRRTVRVRSCGPVTMDLDVSETRVPYAWLSPSSGLGGTYVFDIPPSVCPSFELTLFSTFRASSATLHRLLVGT